MRDSSEPSAPLRHERPRGRGALEGIRVAAMLPLRGFLTLFTYQGPATGRGVTRASEYPAWSGCVKRDG